MEDTPRVEKVNLGWGVFHEKVEQYVEIINWFV